MSVKDTITTTLSKAFELILNQKIKIDEEQGSAFDKLDEKVIQLTFSDIKQTFFIIYQTGQETGFFTVQSHLLGQADSQLKSTIVDWISHDTVADKDDKVGTDFLNALHSIEIDWEEMLSHYTGDMIAFQIGSTIRQGQKNLKSAKDSAGKTIAEYLHFETNLLPTQSQVNRFKKQVQQTEQAVNNIEQRIQKLTKK